MELFIHERNCIKKKSSLITKIFRFKNIKDMFKKNIIGFVCRYIYTQTHIAKIV